MLYCEAENILWSPGIWLTFYCSWHSGVVFLLSGLETILYHSLYLEQQFLKRGWLILFDLTVQCTYRVPFTERFHMHLLHMTHMSFKCIHPLYISRGFSGQWVNRFCVILLSHGIDRWTFSQNCPPSSRTVHLADHRQSEKVWFLIFIATSRVDNCSASSQIRSLSLERACRTTNFVLSCSGIESRTFPRIEGPAPHFWETDWQRTAIRGRCKREGISEASRSQNWGASPSILGKGPSPKKRPI